MTNLCRCGCGYCDQLGAHDVSWCRLVVWEGHKVITAGTSVDNSEGVK